jgi:hypothetical protein
VSKRNWKKKNDLPQAFLFSCLLHWRPSCTELNCSPFPTSLFSHSHLVCPLLYHMVSLSSPPLPRIHFTQIGPAFLSNCQKVRNLGISGPSFEEKDESYNRVIAKSWRCEGDGFCFWEVGAFVTGGLSMALQPYLW